jgi:hypothetical protein
MQHVPHDCRASPVAVIAALGIKTTAASLIATLHTLPDHAQIGSAAVRHNFKELQSQISKTNLYGTQPSCTG